MFTTVTSVLEDSHRARVSGLSEMVIRRRLGIIAQLVEEYSMDVSIRLVPSAGNLADTLTRIPRSWITKVCATSAVTDDSVIRDIQEIHNKSHLRVDRTLFLVRKCLGHSISRKIVEQVVNSCNTCRMVDPSPVRWDHGRLSVSKVWGRVAVDITYVKNLPYLSLIDCGPSRFAIWRRIRNESADEVIRQLRQIFLERGAPGEILMDNGPCFISQKTGRFIREWGVTPIFSCAYKHSGNGIVERNHRTIKRMVARSGGSVEEMVFWYNNTPNWEGNVPACGVFRYSTSLPGESTRQLTTKASRLDGLNPYRVGERVYVKPPNAGCTTSWKEGTITDIIADVVVEVDGRNRHIADVRRIVRDKKGEESVREIELLARNGSNGESGNESREDDESEEEDDISSSDGEVRSTQSNDPPDGRERSRPIRERAPPKWLADFYVDDP